MEQNLDYWDAILATIPQPAIVLSEQLKVETANSSFLETFHVSAKETLNRNIFKLGDGQWNFPEVHRLLNFMLRDGSGRLDDIAIDHDFQRIGRKSFQLSACHLRESPPSSILFALRESRPESKYCRLFETARDGMLIVDAESGRITDANQFMTDLLGYTREQLIGVRFWELEAPVVEPLEREGFERVRAEGVVRFPIVSLQTRQGHVFEAEVIGNITGEGENRSVHFNFRDITERRQDHRQVLVETKRESLRVFARGIAHSFNNLLTVIMGSATLALVDTPATGPVRCSLRAVIEASLRGADLTRQMLECSGKGSRFVLHNLKFSDLVWETASLLKNRMSELVELRFDLTGDPLLLDADPEQMKQLITTLVINAAEAVREGETGYVRVITRRVHVDDEYIRLNIPAGEMSAGTFVVLEVTDSGCGMDPATQDRIFDPFFSTKFTGRGLGLAVAWGIVKGHGGAILVESSAGEGTTFRVFLPSPAVPANNGSEAWHHPKAGQVRQEWAAR
jgi:PAS domain S-box-containing protein